MEKLNYYVYLFETLDKLFQGKKYLIFFITYTNLEISINNSLVKEMHIFIEIFIKSYNNEYF